MERRGVRLESPAAWVVRFEGERSYTIRFDGERWSRQRGESNGDVVLGTSAAEWAGFLAADPGERRRWLRESRAQGRPERLEEMVSAFGANET